MTNKIIQVVMMSLTVLLIFGCATTQKFDASGIDMSITPQHAVVNADSLLDTPLLWGGVIIAARNLKDETLLEILAYPLDSRQKPDADKTPLGRYIVLKEGYLEISDLGEGRLITTLGKSHNNIVGSIGDSEYTYPVLKLEQLHLWSRPGDTPKTQFHMGIGVMFHD